MHQIRKIYLAAVLVVVVMLAQSLISWADKNSVEFFKSMDQTDFLLHGCTIDFSRKIDKIIYVEPLNGSNFQVVSIYRSIFFEYYAEFRLGPPPGIKYVCSKK